MTSSNSNQIKFDPKDLKTISMVSQIKEIINKMQEGHCSLELIRMYANNMLEINRDLFKLAFDANLFGIILVKYRDYNDIMEFVEIGENLQIDFMEDTKNSILLRFLKFAIREDIKKLTEKVILISLEQNRTKFMETIKSCEIGSMQKIMIVDLMWKSQGKSIENNFEDLIEYISSGNQVSGNSGSFTATASFLISPGMNGVSQVAIVATPVTRVSTSVYDVNNNINTCTCGRH